MKYAYLIAGGSLLVSGVAAQAYTEFHFYPKGDFPDVIFQEYGPLGTLSPDAPASEEVVKANKENCVRGKNDQSIAQIWIAFAKGSNETDSYYCITGFDNDSCSKEETVVPVTYHMPKPDKDGHQSFDDNFVFQTKKNSATVVKDKCENS